MKKLILFGTVIALAVCLAADKPVKPEAIASRFIAAMSQQQFSDAAELSTPTMATQIGQLRKNLGNYYSPSATPDAAINIWESTIEDSTGVVRFSIGNDTTIRILGMRAIKRKWLVNSVDFDFVGSPRAVALTFLNGFYHMDYKPAKRVSTDETLKQLASFEEIMGMIDNDAKQQAKALSVDVRSEKIAGDNAALEYVVSGDPSPKTIKLVYQNGKWLVVWSKLDIAGTGEDGSEWATPADR
jgi:hypothetical protein